MSEQSRGDVYHTGEKPSINQKARGVYFFLNDVWERLGSSTGGPRALDQSLTKKEREDAYDELIEKVRQNRKDLLGDMYKDTQRARQLKELAGQGPLKPEDEPEIDALIEKYRPIDQDLELGRLSDVSLSVV